MNVFFKESKFHLDVLLSGFLFAAFHLIHQYRDPVTFSLYFCSDSSSQLSIRKLKISGCPSSCMPLAIFSLFGNQSGFSYSIISTGIFLLNNLVSVAGREMGVRGWSCLMKLGLLFKSDLIFV